MHCLHLQFADQSAFWNDFHDELSSVGEPGACPHHSALNAGEHVDDVTGAGNHLTAAKLSDT